MAAQGPMGVGDIVLGGFRIFSDRWKDLLRLTVVTVLPVSVFGLLLVATFAPDAIMDILGNTMTPEEAQVAFEAITADQWWTLATIYGVFLVVTSAANTIALGGCIVIALDHTAGRARPYGEALRDAFARLPSLLWVVLLSGILTTIGLVLCILPGIWLFTSWLLAPVILFAEGLKGRKALGRSFRLVRPRFWPILLVLILEFVCFFLLQTASSALPPIFLTQSAEQNGFATFFALSLVSTIVGLVGVGLHAGISTVAFFDLRARAAAEPALQPPSQSQPPPPPPPPPPMGL
jgi:hypothetical protein